jgi:hypothetical protein
LWGHLKSVVCATAVSDVADLQQWDADGCQVVQNTSETFEGVWQELMRCAQYCTEVNGQHYQHVF